MSAAEKAMQDITAVVDRWSRGARNEVEVILAISRIVGRYDIERIRDSANAG